MTTDGTPQARRGMNPLVKLLGVAAIGASVFAGGYKLGQRSGNAEQRALEEMVKNYRPAASSIDYGGRYAIAVRVENNERHTYLIDKEKKLEVEAPTDIWDLADTYGWAPSRIAAKAGLKTGLGLKYIGEKFDAETKGEKPYVENK